MQDRFDLLVIGAGPAGGAVAVACREAGLRVAMLEKTAVGGVCPLRGCNPKKVLLGPAELRHAASLLAGKGALGLPHVDWPALQAFKRTFTEPVPAQAEAAYLAKGVEIIHAAGRFLDAHTIQAGDRTLTARCIALCAGRVPAPLAFPGADLCLTSDDFLDLPALPPRLVVLGGGFVAMELASLAQAAGASVTILHRSDRFLRGFDGPCVEALLASLRAEGMTIHHNATVLAVEDAGGNARRVTFDLDGVVHTLDADAICNFAGRAPDLAGLDLPAAGVAFTPAGVTVSPTLQTSRSHIFALGDCAATPYNLTPTASLEGATAAANILALLRGDSPSVVDYRVVPQVCFTLPPVAGVGLTEAEAQAQGIPHRVKTTPLGDLFPWQRLGHAAGLARIVLDDAPDRSQERLLGAHLAGHMAEELINLLALALRANLPLPQIRSLPWAYPTHGYYLRYLL